MSRRLELHEILIDLLGTRGEKESRVYFQPPSTVKMKYPCIVYSRNDANPVHADDQMYRRYQGYMITVVDPNPDSIYPEKVAQLPLCRFDRAYKADNLNHDVYTIYY